MSETYPKVLRQLAALAETTLATYGRELHRYLRRRLRRPQDADDLAQEVYLRLLRRTSTEPVLNARAYVYRVASHVLAEFQTQGAIDQNSVTFDSEMLERIGSEPFEAQELDELAERLDMQRELERVLNELPPTHRCVFLLHKRDGLSHSEVAKALSLSIHTVEKYLIQAKARMRILGWRK